MTKQVQRRRGTSTQHTSFTGAEGEISVNTTNKSIHVHDGSTAGGVEAARADLTNVSDANLNAALAGNTLSSLTITSVDINGGTIDGAVIGGSSAAAGTFTTVTGTSFVTTGDMTFGDNDKAIFGAGSDLQIYHNGSNSFIEDVAGTGSLYIRSNQTVFTNPSGTENVAVFNEDADVRLFYNGAIKLATTATGIAVTGDATFADNGKAIFGAGSDLQIYHDGSQSIIHDTGTGNLRIRGSDITLQDADGNGFISMVDGGAGGTVFLKHLGSNVLATTATGIDVTGTVTADGLTVDGAASINSTVNSSSTSNQLTLRGGTGNVVSGDVVGGINFDSFDLGNQNTSASITAVASGGHVSGSTLDTHLNFKTADGATPLSRLNIGYNGDISFYEDTGTTPKFFWDASAESLGIGNAAPTSALEVTGTVYATSAGGVAFKMNSGSAIRSNTTSATHYMDLGTVNFRRGDGANTQAQVNVYGGGYFAGNVGIGTTSPSGQFEVFNVLTVPVTNTTTIANKRGLSIYNNQSGGLLDTTLVYGNGANSYLAFGHHNGTTYAERMRINSAGNVGIGTSSPATTLDVKASNAVVLIDSSGSSSGIHQKSTSGEHRLLMDSAGFRGYDITNLDDTFTYFGGASGYWRFFTNGSERLRITSAGDVGIGTAAPTNPLDVNADSIRVRTAQTPATAGAAGNQGEIAWDDNYIYVCTATNTWKRVAIATW